MDDHDMIIQIVERQNYADKRSDKMEELLNKTVETVNRLSTTVEKYVDNQNRSDKEQEDIRGKVEQVDNKSKIDIATVLVSAITGVAIGAVSALVARQDMLEAFMIMMVICSIFVGLFVQGIKVMLDSLNVKYSSNVVAGITSVVLSGLVFASYCILVEVQFNIKMAVYLVALVLLSWLGSMIGYDKVFQAITQVKSNK